MKNKNQLTIGKAIKYSLNELKGDIKDEDFAFALIHYAHKTLSIEKIKLVEMLNSSQLDLN